MYNYILEVQELLLKYKLNKEEQQQFWQIIWPIFKHPEFQKRMDITLFPHHHKTSLGHHTINVAIMTYITVKKQTQKGLKIDLNTALIIAMFHDLYEKPWPKSSPKSQIINRHGFTHPLEATINAITWFPSYFKNLHQAQIIIDGIIHHMYPFPVRSINPNFTNTEINNLKKASLLDPKFLNLIISSSQRKPITNLSIAKPTSIEGKIILFTDKIASLHEELKIPITLN